jgi:tetratricopeptide (TPR) repeat protein
VRNSDSDQEGPLYRTQWGNPKCRASWPARISFHNPTQSDLLRTLISIALTVAIFGSSVYATDCAGEVPSTAGKAPSNGEVLSNGKAPAELEKRENLGYVVRFENGPQPFGGFLCGLVSVNNKDLSKLKESELKDLLYGPVGSTLELEIISPDGKTKTEILTREPATNKPMWEHNGLLFSNYDNRNGHNFNGAFVEDSLDVEARATQNLLIQNLKDWPEAARPYAMSPLMFSSAIIDYESGDIADGDYNLDLSDLEYIAGKRWLPFQTRQMGKALKVLISVGKMNDARKVVNRVIDGDTLQVFSADDLFKPLALTEIKTDKKAAVATVERYLDVSKMRPGYSLHDQSWVTYTLEQAGEYKKAEELYDKSIRAVAVNDKRWEMLHILAAFVFERSVLQCKLGDSKAAEVGLQNIIEQIKSSLSADQLATIAKMPGVFPKLSDLETALAAAKGGTAFPPVPDDSYSEPPFPNIRACHNAIKENNEARASSLIFSFLDQYRGHVPQARVSAEKQNLYLCILTLAREMSDHGWFSLSDDVLHRLQDEAYGKDANTLAKAFLQAELAYNSGREKKNPDKEGELFKAIYHSTAQPKDNSPWRDFAWSERLRQMAVVFYYAGELKRAEYFIKEALAENENETGHSTEITHYHGPMGEKTMMLLDAACIAAKQGQFDKAEGYWNKVVALAPLSEDGYRYTVIELCSTYLAKNKRSQAIAMLEAIRSKPIHMERYQLDNGVTAIDLYLAKIFLESGKSKEAKQIADAAADRMPQRLYWPQLLVVAQCDEACGDYARAAKIYANKPWSGSPILFENGDDTQWLERALALADKVPDYDKIALAKLCSDLAERKGFQHAEEAARLAKRARDLTPDSDSKKPQLMVRVAQFEAYANPKDATAVATAAKAALAAVSAKPEVDSFKVERDAAELAERYHQENARLLWTRLAQNEIFEGHIAQAMEHEHHAMDLYTAKDAMNHEGILGYRENFMRGLVGKGQKEAAERLLINAVARTRALAGQGSIATQAQLSDLFCFYAEQGKKPEALKTLDQILQFNLKTGETVSQSLMHSHCGPGWPQAADAVEVLSRVFQAIDQMKPKDLEFSRIAFEKVLTAQKSQLARDDERLIGTIAHLGDAYFDLGKYAEADKYYSEAYALNCKYHKGEYAVRLTGKNYLANLRKVGKEAEADRLAASDWEGVGAPVGNRK